MKNTLFITGTDTGVGKTTFTALALCHLRRKGVHALAMKPFCSGSRADVRLLSALQDHELSQAELNPWFFSRPLAPGVCPESAGIRLRDVVAKVRKVSRRCEFLIVEGAGGILAPLTPRLEIIDLMKALGCPACVVAVNRIGAINHTLLTVDALRSHGVNAEQLVMMDPFQKDRSTSSNAGIIEQKRSFLRATRLPFLGAQMSRKTAIQAAEKKIEKTIAPLFEAATFCASSERRVDRTPRRVSR